MLDAIGADPLGPGALGPAASARRAYAPGATRLSAPYRRRGLADELHHCRCPTANQLTPNFSFAVRHNTIEVSGFGDGVSVIDVGALISGEKTVDATVTNNEIHLDNFFSGVFGFGSHNVAVTNNTFTGAAGESAVSHGVFGDPSGNWRIINNDVSGFEGGIAQIWLGADTFDDLVVTMNPGDDVLDEGINNTIVGPGGRIGAPRSTSTWLEAHLNSLERRHE